MTSLTAVDILMIPDDTMLTHAKSWNARLLESVPTGFALDERHTPHITLLQRYVTTDQLDELYRAVDSVIAAAPVASLDLAGVKLAHMKVAALPGIGLAGLLVKPSPAVLDLQAALIDAVAPFTGTPGTADAYVTSTAEPDINQDTIDYVERYVPDHSGANYLAHVTVGEATLDDLADLEAKPFEAFTFHLTALAAYHLGNNGTAQTELHRWKVA